MRGEFVFAALASSRGEERSVSHGLIVACGEAALHWSTRSAREDDEATASASMLSVLHLYYVLAVSEGDAGDTRLDDSDSF